MQHTQDQLNSAAKSLLTSLNDGEYVAKGLESASNGSFRWVTCNGRNGMHPDVMGESGNVRVCHSGKVYRCTPSLRMCLNIVKQLLEECERLNELGRAAMLAR